MHDPLSCGAILFGPLSPRAFCYWPCLIRINSSQPCGSVRCLTWHSAVYFICHHGSWRSQGVWGRDLDCQGFCGQRTSDDCLCRSAGGAIAVLLLRSDPLHRSLVGTGYPTQRRNGILARIALDGSGYVFDHLGHIGVGFCSGQSHGSHCNRCVWRADKHGAFRVFAAAKSTASDANPIRVLRGANTFSRTAALVILAHLRTPEHLYHHSLQQWCVLV